MKKTGEMTVIFQNLFLTSRFRSMKVTWRSSWYLTQSIITLMSSATEAAGIVLGTTIQIVNIIHVAWTVEEQSILQFLPHLKVHKIDIPKQQVWLYFQAFTCSMHIHTYLRTACTSMQ